VQGPSATAELFFSHSFSTMLSNTGQLAGLETAGTVVFGLEEYATGCCCVLACQAIGRIAAGSSSESTTLS